MYQVIRTIDFLIVYADAKPRTLKSVLFSWIFQENCRLCEQEKLQLPFVASKTYPWKLKQSSKIPKLYVALVCSVWQEWCWQIALIRIQNRPLLPRPRPRLSSSSSLFLELFCALTASRIASSSALSSSSSSWELFDFASFSSSAVKKLSLVNALF